MPANQGGKKASQGLFKGIGQPEEVAAIRNEIRKYFATKDPKGKAIGSHKHGVYAFYDYDDEPIYVGLTVEKLSGRVGRHLTNQRTDAVAMNVLDPFEVATIEVWPFDDIVCDLDEGQAKSILCRAEYTVLQKVLAESAIGAVLNEKDISRQKRISLPESYRQRIVPDEIYNRRQHPDIRIARRAMTIASLARVISERSVSKGLRRTLLTQAKRLERLAEQRAQSLKVKMEFERDETEQERK